MRLKSEIRKEQIKEAVLELIHQEGLRNFTTKRLAGRIGISEAAIFRHFSSKGEILLDILEDVDQELLRLLHTISEEASSARVRLHKVVCRTIHYYVKHRGVSILILSEIAVENDVNFRERMRQVFFEQRKVVECITLEGIEAGEIKPSIDARALSLLFMGIPVGIHLELQLNPRAFDEEGFCEKMTRTFLQSCLQDEDITLNKNH
jgi:AcrR family transcriptional regulator